MEILISHEDESVRLEVRIVTRNIETHSRLQLLPNDRFGQIKHTFRKALIEAATIIKTETTSRNA